MVEAHLWLQKTDEFILRYRWSLIMVIANGHCKLWLQMIIDNGHCNDYINHCHYNDHSKVLLDKSQGGATRFLRGHASHLQMIFTLFSWKVNFCDLMRETFRRMISDPRPLQSLFAGNMVVIIITMIIIIASIINHHHPRWSSFSPISWIYPKLNHQQEYWQHYEVSTKVISTIQAREYSRDETTGQWTLDGGWVTLTMILISWWFL